MGGLSVCSSGSEFAEAPPTPNPSPPRARARGGRGDHRAQLRDLAARFARGLACSFRPLQSEGAGNAGRPMRPIAACAGIVVERTRVSQVTPESPGIPRAMVLTVSFVLSPVIGLFCHRRRRDTSRQLDASVEASGPHDFSVRKISALVSGATCVHRIPHQRP